MIIVKGNKSEEMNKSQLTSVIDAFKNVHVDIGTGDGRFIYKNALKNPETFYIGVDPSQKQLELYSKKVLKNKLNNVLFVVGSIELFPDELYGIASKITIILPWGSLLGAVVSADEYLLNILKKTLKQNGSMQMLFGYSQEIEPTETSRLELENLDINYINSILLPKYEVNGFNCVQVKELDKRDLKHFESTWSRKLVFGQNRPMFLVEFTI